MSKFILLFHVYLFATLLTISFLLFLLIRLELSVTRFRLSPRFFPILTLYASEGEAKREKIKAWTDDSERMLLTK